MPVQLRMEQLNDKPQVQKSPVEKIMLLVKRGLSSGGSLCITLCRPVAARHAPMNRIFMYICK